MVFVTMAAIIRRLRHSNKRLYHRAHLQTETSITINPQISATRQRSLIAKGGLGAFREKKRSHTPWHPEAPRNAMVSKIGFSEYLSSYI